MSRTSPKWIVPAIGLLSLASWGCAHQSANAPAETAGAKDPTLDALARATRDNTALRRRMAMLEDRVLHLESGESRVARAENNGGDGLPVVHLQPDRAPDPSVSTGTWQAQTAAQATRSEPVPAGTGRQNQTIGAQPSAMAVVSDGDMAGFEGAREGQAAGESRSFRLVGSRLAELSRSERKPAAKPAPAASKRKPRGNKAIIARYNDAMSLLRGGEAAAALIAFDAFAHDHPRHDYADNALYWKGESAYDQGHYSDALAAFTAVVERYGGGNKAPDALLKIGLCYAQLGDHANATDVLTELIAAYPSANAGAVARVKLQELPSPRAQDN